MSSIIITFLVIFLVGLMSVLGVFYLGGNVYNTRHTATAAKYINNASQIDSAMDLYRMSHRGRTPEKLETLIDEGYLKDLPSDVWEFGEDIVTASGVSEDVCHEINRHISQSTTIPACSSVDSDFMGCCSSDAVAGQG